MSTCRLSEPTFHRPGAREQSDVAFRASEQAAAAAAFSEQERQHNTIAPRAFFTRSSPALRARAERRGADTSACARKPQCVIRQRSTASTGVPHNTSHAVVSAHVHMYHPPSTSRYIRWAPTTRQQVQHRRLIDQTGNPARRRGRRRLVNFQCTSVYNARALCAMVINKVKVFFVRFFVGRPHAGTIWFDQARPSRPSPPPPPGRRAGRTTRDPSSTTIPQQCRQNRNINHSLRAKVHIYHVPQYQHRLYQHATI